MLSNLYWSVYKNLESELNLLMYSIHIDDNQLEVYSSKVSDLLLRTVVEIESITKDLYKRYSSSSLGYKKYDEIGLTYLEGLFSLSEKVVIISSTNCYQSIRQLKPFNKNELRSNTTKLTFTWNNAYQNIKHDRANSLKYGCIKYLFDGMAALFILNLYFKDATFQLGKSDDGLNFSTNQGSDIFAIKLYPHQGYNKAQTIRKNSDYDEYVYRIEINREKSETGIEMFNKFFDKKNELIQERYKIKSEAEPLFFSIGNQPEAELWIKSQQNDPNIMRIAALKSQMEKVFDHINYQAVLIKND